jgi:glycopeptide antibiotics resistance protein
MLQGPVELQISSTLIVVWVLPTIGALLALMATRDSPHLRGPVSTMVRLMLLAYLFGAILLTLWPLDFEVASRGIDDGNWEPFGGSLGFLISDNEMQNEIGGRDVLANVVLFIPFGALLPFAFYQWRGIVLPAFLIACLAFGLEYVQGLTIAQRTFDIDDPIAGLAGGIVALIVAALLKPLATRHTSAT